LWTGHNDGRVCAFALDSKPGVAVTGRMLNSWQAHRIGSVTVLITTPWGELWSGSSRGIIRVWRHAHKPQGGGHQRKNIIPAWLNIAAATSMHAVAKQT